MKSRMLVMTHTNAGWQTMGTLLTRLAHTAWQCWQNTTSESTIIIILIISHPPCHYLQCPLSNIIVVNIIISIISMIIIIIRVPFYIAMPMSTLDRNCPTGQNIPIEQVFVFVFVFQYLNDQYRYTQ